MVCYYPSAHILCFIIHGLTLSTFVYALMTLMLIGIAALITVVQPYKRTLYIIDTLIALTLTLITASMTSMFSSVEQKRTQSYAASVIAAMSEDIPLLYLIAILLHWVYRSRVLVYCAGCVRGTGR